MKLRRLYLPWAWLVLCATAAVPRPAGAAPAPSSPSVEARIPLSLLIALADTWLSPEPLQALSATEEVRSADWNRMKPLLTGFQSRGIPRAVWFARPDGSYFTVDKGPAGSLKDRPYFPGLISGKTVTGELVISRSTGRDVAVVAVPVRTAQGIVGALGASVYLDRMSERLNQAMRPPAGVVWWAIDSQGRTAVHGVTERIFLYPAKMGSPTLARAVQQILTHKEGTTTYVFEGKGRRAVYATSPLNGWHYVLAVVQ